jgi:hypothetical protein
VTTQVIEYLARCAKRGDCNLVTFNGYVDGVDGASGCEFDVADD